MKTCDGEADFRVCFCWGRIARAEAGEEAGEGEGVRFLDYGEVGGEDAADGHCGQDGATFLEVEGVGCSKNEGKGRKGEVEDGPSE